MPSQMDSAKSQENRQILTTGQTSSNSNCNNNGGPHDADDGIKEYILCIDQEILILVRVYKSSKSALVFNARVSISVM